MKKWDVVIVGAGITGITLAERLANVYGKKVLIIEKRDHIGGNCFDYTNRRGILVSKYGPHLFHTNSEKVWEYVQQFGKWRKYEHRVMSYTDQGMVPIPVNRETINKLFGESLKNDSEMKIWLEARVVKNLSPQNSEEVAVSRVGESLYKILFKNYTKKVWDKMPRSLDPSVLSRIPINWGNESRYFIDKYQYQPEKGFTKMFEKMLDHPNIEVRIDTDFFEIINEIGEYEKLFYSGPIDKYFRHFKMSKIQLEYRCLNFKFKTLNQEFFQPVAVVNYPNKYKFTRITEYKHITGQELPVTTISKEYPGWTGVKCYPVLTKLNIDKYSQLQIMVNKLKKIFFVGRLGSYKYLNMDQAILSALELFENQNL